MKDFCTNFRTWREKPMAMNQKQIKIEWNCSDFHFRLRCYTHKKASSEQPPHQPDLQRDLVGLHAHAAGEEQQQVGEHTNEGRGQQDRSSPPDGRTFQYNTWCFCPFSQSISNEGKADSQWGAWQSQLSPESLCKRQTTTLAAGRTTRTKAKWAAYSLIPRLSDYLGSFT